ncbi:MAG: DUF4293 domain-containing protein [Paraprevotella sp.]|nr:DUF4293 domain-containing protein [Paraprevotella sp.]
MIQRIQTVFLLLASICAVVGLCTPVGHLHQSGIRVANFYNLWLAMADGTRVFSPWAMFVLLLLAAVISLVSIFLFKRRMLQVRLSVFNGLLLIGYYIVFGVFVSIFKSRYEVDFTLSWTVAFPAVALILDYMAFRNIMKDELMIRSLDRLR